MVNIQEIFKQEMTRREFLATIGLGLVAIVGLASLFSVLTPKTTAQQQDAHDYGSGAYGV